MIYNSYEIAKIIGVNVSTIKRWADTGKIKCFKTKGGHRKFHLKHLRDFIRSNKKDYTHLNLSSLIGKSTKILSAIESADSELLSRFSYESLIDGDQNKFLSLMNSMIIKGFPYYFIFDEIIIPALVKIGDEWKNGNISITSEHLASEIIRKFLSSIDNKIANNKFFKNAFCFTLVNDKHDLPLLMAEVIFNQIENINTFNLGASLPIGDFIDESSRVKPDIIFVSVVYVENKDLANSELNALLNNFKNTDTKIFLIGNSLQQLDIKYDSCAKINSFEELQKYIIKS